MDKKPERKVEGSELGLSICVPFSRSVFFTPESSEHQKLGEGDLDTAQILNVNTTHSSTDPSLKQALEQSYLFLLMTMQRTSA